MRIQTVLTANGMAFADLAENEISRHGGRTFDRACLAHGIEHKPPGVSLGRTVKPSV